MSIADTLEYIKEIMWRKKIKISHISKRMGISKTAITKWFKGDSEPTMYHLYELMDIVGIDVILKERK